MSRMLGRRPLVAALVVVAAVLAPAMPAVAFDDVPPSHPFAEEIDWLEAADITGGFPDGGFHPTAPVTRQAMAAVLHRLWLMLGGDATAAPDPSFTDVPPTHPFFADIAWMADEEITGGFGDGGFHPGATVTRQAMAAFMFRFWQALGGMPGVDPDPGFTDVPPTHPFFDDIAWMAEFEITGGFPDGGYHPGASVSRQAMAAFLFRLFDVQTDHVCTDQTEIPVTECTGLVALYYATGGAAWTNNTGWLTSTPPCDWFGLTCFTVAGVEHVVFLNLMSNGLTGPLPTQIDAIAALVLLQLGSNGLTGAIPDDISGLTGLITLTLNDNALSGPVPLGLLDTPGIEVLELAGNGCLTAATTELVDLLNNFDPNWDDGCVGPTSG